MAKTPEYTKKAVDNYRAKYDFIQTRYPKGTIDRLKAAGITSNNDYISGLVLADLDRLEGIKGIVEPEEIPNETL